MNSRIEQLLQLVKVTWDGDLISKQARDALDKECLVTKVRGFTILTDEGVRVLVQLGLLKEETPLEAVQGEVQLTAANSDYAAAERVYREWRQWSNISVEKKAFVPWLEHRLNPPKAADCA